MCDGSVRVLKMSGVTEKTLKAMITRDGGEVIRGRPARSQEDDSRSGFGYTEIRAVEPTDSCPWAFHLEDIAMRLSALAGRRGKTLIWLLVGLLIGGAAGAGAVYVLKRGKAGIPGGPRLGNAEEVAMIPADAIAFVHFRARDLWKSEELADLRKVLDKAGPGGARDARRGLRPRALHARPSHARRPRRPESAKAIAPDRASRRIADRRSRRPRTPSFVGDSQLHRAHSTSRQVKTAYFPEATGKKENG